MFSRYALSDSAGVELAEKLLDAHSQLSSHATSPSNLPTDLQSVVDYSTTHCDNHSKLYHLPQGSFQVVLLIDQIELNNNPQILSLLANQVRYQVRKLNIGDYIWIAKSKTSSSISCVCVCLTCIIVNDVC